jgi:hypothetical protein
MNNWAPAFAGVTESCGKVLEGYWVLIPTSIATSFSPRTWPLLERIDQIN